jgi:hypothetical protein
MSLYKEQDGGGSGRAQVTSNTQMPEQEVRLYPKPLSLCSNSELSAIIGKE